MLALTAITLGLSLLKNAQYETLKEVEEPSGLQVYDHSPTPVEKVIFDEKFEIVVFLTVASRYELPKAKMIAVG
jgi:hypothetical protein